MDQENKKTNILSLVFNVAFWGALWGIVEATLGTILHLPAFDRTGIYLSSSAIIIPIAFCLMANCYKKTNSFYAVYLMGLIAACIKLSVAFVVGFIDTVYTPALYIVVEALSMGTALLIFRPTNVLSLKTLAAFIVGNTMYQFLFLSIRAMNGTVIFTEEAFAKTGVKYLFTCNDLAIIYSFAVGSISYGVLRFAEKHNWKFNFDMKKLVNSPITASVSLVLAFAITITLAAVL